MVGERKQAPQEADGKYNVKIRLIEGYFPGGDMLILFDPQAPDLQGTLYRSVIQCDNSNIHAHEHKLMLHKGSFHFPCRSKLLPQCAPAVIRHRGNGGAAGLLTGMTNSLLSSALVVLISQLHAQSTASTSQGHQHLDCHRMFTLIPS